MSDSTATKPLERTQSRKAPGDPGSPQPPQRLWLLGGSIAALALAFLVPLKHLWTLALDSDLYSHTLLIPLVSLYLVWENRGRITPSSPQRALALIPLAVGAASLIAFVNRSADPANPQQIEDYLGYSIFAFVNFVIAANCLFVGRAALKTNLFPILFLVFMTPFTVAVREGIEAFFQYASADVAYWFIKISGIPIFREGLVFYMPNINMEVAPQCSGIRSSLVLFIVSLVGSYFFLQSNWKRATIVLLVIPLGILRNGIRILVLAQLCHHYGADMIHSWFHHSGGPPLFAATLVPLFLLLYLFRRSETKKADKAKADA